MEEFSSFYNFTLSAIKEHYSETGRKASRGKLEKLSLELKLFRKERSMTQEDLAKRIGVNRRQVIRWEKGETRPEIRILEKLRKTGVDVDIEYLKGAS